MDHYFLETQGRRIGPLGEDDLRGYFRSQLLRPLDMISGGPLPVPISANDLASQWQLEFRPRSATPAVIPATRMLVMQRDDSWPAGVRAALVAVALALAGWWLLAPRADIANIAPSPALASASASSPRPTNSPSTAPMAGAASAAHADGGGAPSGFPEPKLAPRPSAATGNSTGAWEAQAASVEASAAGAASAPSLGQVQHHWLETAEEYSGDCCWGRTAVDASQAAGWVGLGNAYSQMPDHEQAIEAYRRSLQIDGHDPDVLRALGEEYYHTNRFKEAIATYEQAIAIAPQDARVKEDLARAKQR